jgi:hypothetical protein
MVCKDCFIKSRAFPQAKVGAGGKKAGGQICKLCDRKFFMKDLVQKSHIKIFEKDKRIKRIRLEE